MMSLRKLLEAGLFTAGLAGLIGTVTHIPSTPEIPTMKRVIEIENELNHDVKIREIMSEEGQKTLEYYVALKQEHDSLTQLPGYKAELDENRKYETSRMISMGTFFFSYLSMAAGIFLCFERRKRLYGDPIFKLHDKDNNP